MKYLKLLLFLCIAPLAMASVANVYVAQTSAGSNNGTSCANAFAATFFNTGGNWGTGGSQVGPGTTVHLCGTITTSLAAQGSGSMGSPVTILFETGAIVQQPVCSASVGCLSISGQSWIIVDGGSACGWISGALVACNGIIQSTLNGTSGAACPGGPCSNQADSIGLVASNCSNCEIRNLNLAFIYYHTLTTDTHSFGTFPSAIYWNNESNSIPNILVHNNVIHDCAWCLLYNYGSDSNVQIYNNDIYNTAHGIAVAGFGANAATGIKIYSNYIHDYANWDTGSSDTYHLAGIHAYGTTVSNTTGTQIYDNLFSGPITTMDFTAHIYLENYMYGAAVFNNVLLAPASGTASFGLIAAGGGSSGAATASIYNNTILDDGNGICILVNNVAGAALITVKNNLCSGAATGIYYYSTGTYSIDYNTYAAMVGSNTFYDATTFYSAISAWRTAVSQDAHSQLISTAHLNMNGTLQSNSGAIKWGANLTSLSIAPLDSDFASVARPSSGTCTTQGTTAGCWDDGAYQFAAAASCGSGSSTITGAHIQGQTHRQAIVSFSVPHANAATVQLFSDSLCTQVIDDTNTVLFSGSSSANRSGSVISGVVSGGSLDGTDVEFIAGTLTGNRSLTQATPYWAQITNTADSSQITVPLMTAVMPLGNLFPEQPPASTSRWDNRGYPVFAQGPSGRNTLLTDPTTGLLVKRGTYAGDTYSQRYTTGDGIAPAFDTPIDNNGTCSNTANLASAVVTGYPTAPGSGYATCPNNMSVWLPMPAIQPPGGGSWGNNGEGAYAPTGGLDYINLFIFGSTSSGTTILTVTPTLTATGAAYQGSPGITVTLNSATNAGFVVPCVSSCTSGSVPDPGFASWGFAKAPLRGDMLPSQTTVSVTGSTVTGVSGDPFQSTWPSGSLILIPGSSSWTGTPCTNSRCHISAVTSSTTLTITENCSSSCPTSASAVAKVFGFKITGNGAGGTVSLQAGYEYGSSPPWQIGEDAGQQHCNANSVTVTTTATGTPYSGFTLNGNLCWIEYDAFQHGAFYLFIPTDQNGAPLGEMRPLGWTTNAINWSSNGASMATPSFSFAGWDPTQGNKGYATLSYNSGATVLLVSFIYDTTKSGCNPAYTNWAGMALYQGWIAYANSPTDPCFTYTNLTNPTNSTDVVTQIKANYSTISTAAMGLGTGTVYLDGYFLVTLGGGGNPEISVGATFDTTGTLKQTFDSFSQYPARWGAVHGPLHQIGTFHAWTMDPTFSGSSGNALQGPWQMVTDNVNTAGFGSTPTWSGSSTLNNTTNKYQCPSSAQMQALGVSPTMAAAMVSLGSAGNNCVEIEVTTPPYSATPGSGTPYPGGMTEQQQFPCSFSAMFSCLQPLAVGDHFMDPSLGSFGEGFIIVTPPASGGGSKLQMWVIRGSGLWPNNLRTPYATVQAHSNGWTGYMQALQIVGCTPMYGDSSAMTHVWTEGYFGFCLSHGADTRGTLSSNENVMSQNLVNPTFDTLFNASIAINAMPTWYATSSLGNTLTYPTFNGSTSALNNGNLIQLYADAGNLNGGAQRQWAVAERHLNPSSGTGGEFLVGMGTSGYTLSLVGGKSQTYTITDPYSNGAPDPKNLPFMAWAGRYMLPDYSGLSSVLPDTGQGFCYTLVANECVSGSSPGTMYVTISAATGCTQGLINQHSTTCPAVVNAGTAVAQMQQISMNGLDLNGAKQRVLGQGITGAGRQWQFNGPKLTPDGGWYLFTCIYPDGLRVDLCLGQIPKGTFDSQNRGTFINTPIQTGGVSGDTVRGEFFYQEWGGCTSRQDHCYTSSSATASNPYVFSYETQHYTTCSSGCTVMIPALPGRILYYALHRLNGSETVGPISAIAIN